MPRFHRRFAMTLLSCSLLLQLVLVAAGDEVVIDDRATAKINLGDFNCSSCPEQVTSALALSMLDEGELSAGQLWQFFHEQGVASLDRLTLYLDVDQLDSQSVFDLRSVEFQIEDPTSSGQFLTNVSLGNNNIVVPGHGTSSHKPEAKLEIMLGYDFMERFSASSTEKIKLDFSSNSELASNAKFSIEGNGKVFTGLNMVLLVSFGAFWIVVFFLMNLLTKPMVEAEGLSSATNDFSSPDEVEPKKKAPKQALSA